MITVKTKKVIKNKLKKPFIKGNNVRYTFTLSATNDFSQLMDYFDKRLSGLNRAEIVKLALIELRQSLASKDLSALTPIFLTDEQEKSLIESVQSPKTQPMTPEEMVNWLDN